MLYKKELLTIPLPVESKISRRQDKVSAKAAVVELPRSGCVLVVDFFQYGAWSRFYTDGNTYWTLIDGELCQRYPFSLNSYDSAHEDDDTTATVRGFLFPDEERYGDARWLVRRFIAEKYEQKRQKQWDSRARLQKQHFDMFPKLPKNLDAYCENHVFQSGYLFVFKKDKHGRKGKCSHCGRTFPVGEYRSSETTTCPKCGWKLRYKPVWRGKEIADKEPICIAHKVDGQLLIRWTYVNRLYILPNTKARFDYQDFAYNLHLNSDGRNTLYFYKWFTAPYSCFGPEWHRLHNGETCFDESYVYTDNLQEVFGSCFYNVNLAEGLSGKTCKLSFPALLNNLRDNPIAEYLFKLGLPIMAANANRLTGGTAGNGEFFETMGVSKQYLPMYRDMNVTMCEHRLIKRSRQFIHPEDLRALRELGIKDAEQNVAEELLETMTVRKFASYMTAQKNLKRQQRYSLHRLMIQYQDYISMLKDLKIDLSHKAVRYPRDIVEAHRLITDRYNAVKVEIEREKNAEIDRQFREQAQTLYARLGVASFAADGFTVVFPQSRTDLIAEGHSLNHCVGQESYYRNHIKGTKMIFFIREASKPERPFFTMELDMTSFRILQLYGFGDCSAPEEVRAFAQKFAASLRRAATRKIA